MARSGAEEDLLPRSHGEVAAPSDPELLAGASGNNGFTGKQWGLLARVLPKEVCDNAPEVDGDVAPYTPLIAS